jgi:Cyanobacterial TRADD-N associated 2-Transmembrane domain
MGLSAAISASLLTNAISALTKNVDERIEVAQDEKASYQQKLENADEKKVYRYVYLINNASIELYVQQSRQQASASFLLSRRVALAGFALLIVSIVIGIISQFGSHPMAAAYLAGIGGILTEFISGVFFYLYNRTLQQVTSFYDRMAEQQQQVLAALAVGRLEPVHLELGTAKAT